MAVGAYWRCPICLRRVPDKVAECYCGRRRQPGDGPDEADAPESSGGAVWYALAAGVAVCAAAFVVLRTGTPAASASTPPLASRPAAAGEATASTPELPVHPRDVPAFTGSSPPPAGRPAEPPPTTAAAEPRATPTPEDSVDARRAQARLAFENAMRNLQGRAAVLRRRLDNLARTCPPEATRVIGCDSLKQEIAQDVNDIRTAADEAVEAARRGWVDPGAVRDARERYDLREGDLLALLARAEDALER